ncbi:hypothetical protein C0J52_22079 [Blattella germanica]|nr:hypothetical protein C0J52_22079 [Blattella germanica]
MATLQYAYCKRLFPLQYNKSCWKLPVPCKRTKNNVTSTILIDTTTNLKKVLIKISSLAVNT